jgi:uncharacterized membrane protein
MSKHLRVLVILAAVLGVSLSALSLYEHILLVNHLSEGPSFCNISAAVNCDAVNGSEYAVLLGVPLASYGLLFYLAVGALFACLRRLEPSLHASIVDVLFLSGLLATFFSLYLFYISHFIIGTLCILCLGMYAVNFSFLAAGYLSERERPAGERLRHAFAVIFRFVRSAVSFGNSAGSKIARRGMLALATVALIIYFAPAIVLF